MNTVRRSLVRASLLTAMTLAVAATNVDGRGGTTSRRRTPDEHLGAALEALKLARGELECADGAKDCGPAMKLVDQAMEKVKASLVSED